MCFSAKASFTAGVVLLAIGTVTLKAVRRKQGLAFAAIPMLFALQQFTEGILWLTFEHEAPLVNTAMTYGYTFFSHVLWPVYVPIAVWLIEPNQQRRRTLAAFVAGGVAVGLYLLYLMVKFPVISRPASHHIEYVMPHFFAAMTMTLYFMSTGVSLIFSTYPTVKFFGVLALLSFVVAYAFYATWFISVWCFFAGLMSAVVYLHFYPHFGGSRVARN